MCTQFFFGFECMSECLWQCHIRTVLNTLNIVNLCCCVFFFCKYKYELKTMTTTITIHKHIRTHTHTKLYYEKYQSIFIMILLRARCIYYIVNLRFSPYNFFLGALSCNLAVRESTLLHRLFATAYFVCLKCIQTYTYTLAYIHTNRKKKKQNENEEEEEEKNNNTDTYIQTESKKYSESMNER